jgi:hypothetical protein
MTRLTFLAEDLILHPANHSLAGKDKRFVGAERQNRNPVARSIGNEDHNDQW